MRVAYLNRQKAAYPGGDLVQIDNTITALAKLGVEAVYAPEGWTLDWLKSFDLVHIFHCNFGWSKYNFDRTREARMPYVVTPIFYPDCSLGMSASNIFTALNEAEAVLPFSYTEWDEINSTLWGWAAQKNLHTRFEAIPNGTSEIFRGLDGSPRHCDVICVTARAGDKNTDLIKEACYQADLDFTLITGRSEAEVALALKDHIVFVNPSTSERMSLTTGEALCAGCRVIDTQFNRGNEWYGPGLVTVNMHPSAGNSVFWARQLRSAIEAKVWDYSPNRAARHLTWDLVAEKLKKVYMEVL